MHVWEKSVPAKQADQWRARLAFFAAEQLVIVEREKRKRAEISIYLPHAKAARALASAFGGSVRLLKSSDWRLTPVKPLSIGGRLTIAGDPKVARALRKRGPTLCIPAAMAFGSGEHATTAMCLRMLAENAHKLRNGPWTLLDLGCGSGILALAGCVLGASQALGYDIDPAAVRIARENAEANGIHAAVFRRLNLVERWKPAGAWDVIAANLFSESILALLPRMCAALAPTGRLILSGILKEQAPEITRALTDLQMEARIKRKGRWVMIAAEPNST